MAFGDLTRIGTNLQSMQSLRTLQNTNSELGMRQLRLATGSRLNAAEDDSAGYSMASKRRKSAARHRHSPMLVMPRACSPSLKAASAPSWKSFRR